MEQGRMLVGSPEAQDITMTVKERDGCRQRQRQRQRRHTRQRLVGNASASSLFDSCIVLPVVLVMMGFALNLVTAGGRWFPVDSSSARLSSPGSQTAAFSSCVRTRISGKAKSKNQRTHQCRGGGGGNVLLDWIQPRRRRIDLGDATTGDVPSEVIVPEAGAGSPCVIKVLGVGGGGGNAVNRMIETAIEGVSFWAINTDSQALTKSLSMNVLNIGRKTTRGLGAGGDPDVGCAAAKENAEEIKDVCRGADMIFITAGMGGGTGSGAAPIVADIAKNSCGALTVGVVTKPFAFEGRRRMRQAEKAIEELRQVVDTLIVVSNDKLLRIVPENTPVTDAFLVADDILRQGVVGISEIIIKAGLVNVDFADVKAVMSDAGTALMGVGTGVGRNRAADAAVAAISSPLLEFPLRQAKRIVYNVVGGPGLGLNDLSAASEVISENAFEDANIIFGALIDENMADRMSITVIACDLRKDLVVDEPAPKQDPAAADSRDPNFYKDRRQQTRSPLGPDASLEETRLAITRGFKKPPMDDEEDDSNDENRPSERGIRGFFRRWRRKRRDRD